MAGAEWNFAHNSQSVGPLTRERRFDQNKGALWTIRSLPEGARPVTVLLRTVLAATVVCLGTLVVAAEPPAIAPAPAKPEPYAWKTLFDGKSLDGWKATSKHSDILSLDDGMMVIAMGDGVNGIKYTGDVPKSNYEFTFEAQRLEGGDFFASPTFPVGDEHCTFVAGGWGGTLTGISSVDWADASENDTTGYKEFKNRTWYRYRVRVSDRKVEAWIDDEKLVDLPREHRRFTTRFEVDRCKPFGIASWCTRGAIRNVRIREIKPEEVKAIPAEPDPKK